MTTATQSMMRIDLRRRRAEALTAAVLQKLWPRIDATDPEELHHRITRLVHETMFEVMFEHGVEVLTDHTRAEAGLPARGPDGWTMEELAALERSRLHMLLKPLGITIPADQRMADLRPLDIVSEP